MLQGGIRTQRIGCSIRPFLRYAGFRKTQMLTSGNLSNNQGQSTSEAFGAGAVVLGSSSVALGNGALTNTGGTSNVAVGASANVSTSNGTSLGKSAVVSGAAGTAVGQGATCASSSGTALGSGTSTGTANNVVVVGASSTAGSSAVGAVAIGEASSVGASSPGGIAIGLLATVAASNSGSIAIGHSATTTAAGQLVVSSADNAITDVYVGNGVTAAAPANVTHHSTGTANGTSNTAGANYTIQPGAGTGTGLGGAFVVVTTAAGLTGSSPNVTTTNALSITGDNKCTFANGVNFVFGTTTGTQFGGATNQKISFYGATQIIQPTGSITAALGALGLVGSPTMCSASGRSVAAVAAVTSVATYTAGAADGSFQVSANVLVTASVTNNFTVTVAYTDESNTPRTLTLSFSNLTGTFATAITNVTGVGPYEGVPMHIRCKAATTITIATTGTFTSVTYNVDGVITQIA